MEKDSIENRRQFHRLPFVTIASIHCDEFNLPVELLGLSLERGVVAGAG